MTNMDAAVPHPRAPLDPGVGAEQLLAHASWARALAARLVEDAATADDVVQRAWLAAVERAPRQAERAKAWLGSVVRHLASKERRAAARRGERERVAALPEATPGADLLVAELEAQRLVVDALLAIEEPYRETLVRRWYRDEKPAAIAAAMGLPVRTVETRLARGLERLRAELTARRGAPRQWGLALVPLAWPLEATTVAAAGASGSATVLGTFVAGVAAMSGTMKLASAAVLLLATTATWWAWPELAIEPAAPAQVARGEESAPPDATLALAQREAAPGEESGDAASGAGAAAPPLIVRLLDLAEAPVEDFWGALLVPDAEPELFDSEDAGQASVTAPSRDAEVIVMSFYLPPTRVAVAAGATTLDIHARRGTPLRGRFHVAGRPPGRPLQGWFQIETPLAILADLPPARRRIRLNHDAALPKIAWACDAAGHFEVSGLDPETRGELEAPYGWSFAPLVREFDGRLTVKRTLAIERPAADLAIELWPLPTIVARVVDEEGVPLAGASLRVRGNSASGGFLIESHLGGSEARVPLDWAIDEPIEATFACDDASGSPRIAQVTIEPPIEGIRDLGTIVLTRPTAWRYRLGTADGTPVERATFAFFADGEQRGEPIDVAAAEGELTSDAPRADRLVVVAAGFAPLEVALDGLVAEEDLLDLVLEPANELALLVRVDGEPRDVRLELSAARSPFARAARTAFLFDYGLRRGCELVDQEESAEGWRCEVEFNSDARPRFAALEPDVPLRLRFCDRLGAPWHEESVALGRTEQRVVAVDWSAPQRGFTARVFDEEGKPVEAAYLTVRLGSDEEAGRCSANSDATGLVVTPPFSAERVSLELELEGYETVARRDVAVPPVDSPLKITMRHAWPLALLLRREGGAPLEKAAFDSAVAWVDHDGRRIEPQRCTDGRLRFVDLPRAPARLHVAFAGREFEQPIAPPAEQVVVVLPPTGRVVIRYDLPLPDLQRLGRVLRAITLEPLADQSPPGAATGSPPRGAELSTDTTLFDPPRRAAAVEFPAVLPGRYRLVLRWKDESAPPRGSLDRDPTEVTLEVAADGSIEAKVAR